MLARLVLMLSLAATGCAQTAPPAPAAIAPPSLAPDTTRIASSPQLILVLAPAWNATTGLLARFHLAPNGTRTQLGSAVPVTLGRSGLAWGRGLHGPGAPAGRPGPLKHEGDGRSPAGAFRLGPATGYTEAHPANTRLPYLHATRTTRCVDDPKSRHYNRLIEEPQTPKDWSSAELMLRPDDLYQWTIFIAHNTDPEPKPNEGSCIFLHLWRAPDSPTEGCTALNPIALEDLISWTDPETTILIQLPEEEFQALQKPWNLPELGRP